MHKRKKPTGGKGKPRAPHPDRQGGPPRGLAARIVARRMARGLTQVAAAKEMGVNRRTLAGWELGTPPSPLALRVLKEWLR